MKPIGQTFYVNEPPAPTGAAGVFLTKADVYFQSISSTYGIQLQIRTTENGYPTPNQLPFASKILYPSDINASTGLPYIIASADASIPTTFEFETPVFLEANKSYALVLMPLGGNPDYNVWTAEIGQTDVVTNSPIHTNSDSGDLFLSSNDIDWTPIITEDMKYTLYIANFTSTSGSAYFYSPDTEILKYKDIVGTFIPRETIAFANGYYNVSSLNISSVAGSFGVGDTVYQSNGSANVSGIVYFSNSSLLKVSNTTGTFANATLYNSNSSSNCLIVNNSQTFKTIYNSNVISVPDTSIFSSNLAIFVQTNNRSNTQVLLVSSVNAGNNTITVTTPVIFTDTAATCGPLMGNGGLLGILSSQNINKNGSAYAYLDYITASNTYNLSGVSNVQVIGVYSTASANLISIVDLPYNSLTTNFSSFEYPNTSIDWSFQGFSNNATRTPDSNYIPINDGSVNEFIDQERIFLSRSNEIAKLPTGRSGNNSIFIKTDLTTDNYKISPVIDIMRTQADYTHNIVTPNNYLSGFYLNTSNSTNSVVYPIGTTLYQNSYGNVSSGVVGYANSSYVRITNVNGYFVSNVNITSAVGNSFVNTASLYNESIGNGIKTSRYISKNIILTADQSSEDVLLYLGAYRPANTNFKVYVKIQNSSDPDNISQKKWSLLDELSSSSLLSSKVNFDDRVELIYGFNKSYNLFGYGTNVANNTNVITCQSTSNLANNQMVYLQYANSTVSNFNVREIIYVVNTTSFVVDRNPSFTNSNSSLGVVPGIETTDSAFLYDQNNYVTRYSTLNDIVYDTYTQYAIKIVPTADSTSVVPRAGDLRLTNLMV